MTTDEQAAAPAPGVGHNQGPAFATPQGAWSVRTFCAAHSISRAMLYSLWEIGKGPPKCRVGGKILIPREGARDWLFSHQEAPAA